MKFKPGDEIVVVRVWQGMSYENGTKGTVESRHAQRPDMLWWSVWVEADNVNRVIDEAEMEHAYIVASPLWRALE